MSLYQLLEPQTYQIDSNIREMFLNFPLNVDVWAYCGINVMELELEALTLDRYC